ncbi:phosphate acetyltransferase [Actinobaculum suis]|uniref:Phosphate acetyltransferase n=1 Tax=Actinobaculum suis TaxID=1657 RepID=A0A1G7ATM6_9ACTO|nr:phosphate acetyltransferase [Actinobaculum suis]MDY5153411.1 phosphate acetyltransferase [Actinobaculum suis]SDE17355.1 phosphate acetyltransferase [Actinobaculum suis]
MAYSVYLTAAEGNAGTLGVATAYIDLLLQEYSNIGVFRAFANGPIENDSLFLTLLERAGKRADAPQAWGTTRRAYVEDEETAMNQLVNRYTDYAQDLDAVLILGLCDGDPVNPGMLARSGRAAANLGTSVVPVVAGSMRSPAQVEVVAELAAKEISESYAPVSALVVTDAPENLAAEYRGDASQVVFVAEGTAAKFAGNDAELLLAAVKRGSDVVTPLAFQANLISRARAAKKTIVLPESEDDRILQATAQLLARDVANIVLLGEEAEVRARAAELGLNIDAAQIVSLHDPDRLHRYAEKFAELRAKKGVTYEQAQKTMEDPSYFGTMMVYLDEADGMVSGANHTTANTIVPSFQTIKTKPGTAAVSGAFLMLLDDRVYVYADCAVNISPTPEQLAGIAVDSARTAAQFGVEPRVAMLSYSTGTSGKGPLVDAVVEATRLAKEKAPDLLIEGPIQYDAAVDPAVAAKKLPGSPVAGRATVFVFPDLNAGNIGYKAVQRSSGAVAVGPVLQGLNKPVNDLSRGALVEDIVNTVAITAIQAQG